MQQQWPDDPGLRLVEQPPPFEHLQVLSDASLLRPLRWEDARLIIDRQAFVQFRRSRVSLEAYRAFMRDIKAKFESVGDMVMVRKNGYAVQEAPDGRLRAVRPTNPEFRLLFEPNDFPYYFVEGIQHHVLWVQGAELTMDALTEWVPRYRDPALFDVLYFVNPPGLRTVPEMSHAHIISRPKSLAIFQPQPRMIATSPSLPLDARPALDGATTIEVCVDSVAAAQAAQAGGAHRLELCSALSEGGLTPSLGLCAAVMRAVSLPVHVMIRSRGGDFCYSDEEMDVMLMDLAALRSLGVAGAVFGCLTPEGEVDWVRWQAFESACTGAHVTFHRAIDMSRDPVAVALALVQRSSCRRILSSGGAATAQAGAQTLAAMQQAVGAAAQVVPAGGVSAENAADLVHQTGARQLHGSARAWLESPMTCRTTAVSMSANSEVIPDYQRKSCSADLVRALVAAVRAPTAATAAPN